MSCFRTQRTVSADRLSIQEIVILDSSGLLEEEDCTMCACSAMAYVVPWCMYCHGECSVMVRVVPWCMYCYGVCSAMVHVVPWRM